MTKAELSGLIEARGGRCPAFHAIPQDEENDENDWLLANLERGNNPQEPAFAGSRPGRVWL